MEKSVEKDCLNYLNLLIIKQHQNNLKIFAINYLQLKTGLLSMTF